MARSEISFTELTHQVVRESPEPLPFAEIMQRVNDIMPITTKNPKSTIRSAVSQSRLIVATGDGRYGWKPRLITGSVLRLTLSELDLTGEAIEFGDELQDALWPAFFESTKRRDIGPVQVELPTGMITQFALEHLGKPAHWGTRGSPEFWAWFEKLGAVLGDHLIFHVLDGEAKLHRVEFEPRSARDEAAIAERNQVIVQAALTFVRKRHYGTTPWELTVHLLSTGQYRHPIPPDPLSEIWTPEVWAETLVAKEIAGGGWFFTGEVIEQPKPDSELSILFGAPVQVYDYENPPDLPHEYDPDRGQRRPRASRKAKEGSVKTFVFRVNHRALPRVWRDIELAEDQNLEDLHLMIQRAYDWGDDHLYSFFMSGQAWDKSSEIGSPWSDTSLHTHQVEIGQLNLKSGQKFLYLFDYGDSHEFDVQLLKIKPSAPPGRYPKIVARRGQAPAQYPDY